MESFRVVSKKLLKSFSFEQHLFCRLEINCVYYNKRQFLKKLSMAASLIVSVMRRVVLHYKTVKKKFDAQHLLFWLVVFAVCIHAIHLL